jgi:putative ABC transport system permease protein
MGEGAGEAVAALDGMEDSVVTWDSWISDQRDSALVGGVERAMIFAVAAVALLAIVCLIATVIGGARARGRTLSMLRTLSAR